MNNSELNIELNVNYDVPPNEFELIYKKDEQLIKLKQSKIQNVYDCCSFLFTALILVSIIVFVIIILIAITMNDEIDMNIIWIFMMLAVPTYIICTGILWFIFCNKRRTYTF